MQQLRGGGVSRATAALALVAAVWVGAWELLRGCCVGVVRGWHGSDARDAPEVRVEGCTS